MKKVIAYPLVGVANITFGMKSEEIRKNLAGFKKEFQKSPIDPQKVDDFGYCHVYYSNDDKCEAIEFFTEVEIQINGRKISPGKIEPIKGIITDLLEEDENLWISKSCSIGITTRNGMIQTILFGCAKYYC